MTYGDLKPYLKAWAIIIKDRNYQEVTEKKAMRRIVERIEAGKVRPDEIYIYIH